MNVSDAVGQYGVTTQIDVGLRKEIPNVLFMSYEELRRRLARGQPE